MAILRRQDAGVVKIRGRGQRRDAHCTCKHCQTGSPYKTAGEWSPAVKSVSCSLSAFTGTHKPLDVRMQGDKSASAAMKKSNRPSRKRMVKGGDICITAMGRRAQ